MMRAAKGRAAGARPAGARSARGGEARRERGRVGPPAASVGDPAAAAPSAQGAKTFTLHAGATSVSFPMQREVVQVRRARAAADSECDSNPRPAC